MIRNGFFTKLRMPGANSDFDPVLTESMFKHTTKYHAVSKHTNAGFTNHF